MSATPLPSPFTLLAPRLRSPGWRALALLGGLTTLVYWLGLLLPYNIFALRLKPLLDIAKLTRHDPAAQAGHVLTWALLAGLYYLAWRVCRAAGRAGRARQRTAWVALLGSLLAINLSLLWLYPIGAADLFDNISRGRITAEYGGNPFYQTPRDYPADAFYRYVAWRKFTSAYGPAWELLAAGTSRIAGDDVLANVLAFKLLNLLFYLGCILLIAAILRRRAPERTPQGVCLFAWNPLVLYETAGNGHNDVVMAFWILLGMYLALRDRFVLASLALVVGALTKFIPILLVPMVLAAGLRTQPACKSRLSLLARAGLACVALIVAAYAPFWRGGDPLSLERRGDLFTTSLPAFVQAQLEPPIGSEASREWVARGALILTAGVVLWQAWKAWRGANIIHASTSLLLFYLLVACLWFQTWYALWPLALAALLPEGALSRTAVLLSYAAPWKTIIFDFFLYQGGPLPPRTWRETWLGPVTFGLVWLYAAYALLRPRLSRLSPLVTRSGH
jgi:hypothetical protein